MNTDTVGALVPQFGLSVARGIILGCLLGSAIWLAVAFAVARLVG